MKRKVKSKSTRTALSKILGSMKKSRGPKKYSEEEQMERRKEDHNAITNYTE